MGTRGALAGEPGHSGPQSSPCDCPMRSRGPCDQTSSHSGSLPPWKGTSGPQPVSGNLISGGLPSFPNCERGLSVPRLLVQTRCLMSGMGVHTSQRPPTSQPPRKARALVSLTCPAGSFPRLSGPGASRATALAGLWLSSGLCSATEGTAIHTKSSARPTGAIPRPPERP